MKAKPKAPNKPKSKKTDTVVPLKRESKTATSQKPPTKSATDLQAKARAEFHRLQVVMAGAHRSELVGWDRYWESVGLIVAKSLYTLDGYERAADWLKDTVEGTVRNANRCIRVATIASPDEEARYTITKIDLALSLRDAEIAAGARKKDPAFKPPITPSPIDLPALKYTVVRDGKKTKLSLREVTTDELRALLHTYASPSRTKKPKLGPVALELSDLLRAHSTLNTLSVTSRDGMIQLGAFRADQCDDLARLLAQVGH